MWTSVTPCRQAGEGRVALEAALLGEVLKEAAPGAEPAVSVGERREVVRVVVVQRAGEALRRGAEVHAEGLGVVAQVEIESNARKRCTIFQIQALKPSAVKPGAQQCLKAVYRISSLSSGTKRVNPVLTRGEPAPPYLGHGGGDGALHPAAQLGLHQRLVPHQHDGDARDVAAQVV
jgi:hypothetical protein